MITRRRAGRTGIRQYCISIRRAYRLAAFGFKLTGAGLAGLDLGEDAAVDSDLREYQKGPDSLVAAVQGQIISSRARLRLGDLRVRFDTSFG